MTFSPFNYAQRAECLASRAQAFTTHWNAKYAFLRVVGHAIFHAGLVVVVKGGDFGVRVGAGGGLASERGRCSYFESDPPHWGSQLCSCQEP